MLYEGNRCSKKGLIPYFIEFVRIYEWMLVCRWCDWRNDDRLWPIIMNIRFMIYDLEFM